MTMRTSSSSKVIVLLAALVAAAFLVLAAPAIASDGQTPVGYYAEAPLTVNGGHQPLGPLQDSKANNYCRINYVPRPRLPCGQRSSYSYICHPNHAAGAYRIQGTGTNKCVGDERVDCVKVPCNN